MSDRVCLCSTENVSWKEKQYLFIFFYDNEFDDVSDGLSVVKIFEYYVCYYFDTEISNYFFLFFLYKKAITLIFMDSWHSSLCLHIHVKEKKKEKK